MVAKPSQNRLARSLYSLAANSQTELGLVCGSLILFIVVEMRDKPLPIMNEMLNCSDTVQAIMDY